MQNRTNPLKKMTLAIFAGCFLWVHAASAESVSPPPEKPTDTYKVEKKVKESYRTNPYENYLSFSYENDLIGDGNDKYYTNGVRMTYYNIDTDLPDFMLRWADAIPGFDLNDATSTFFTLGQNMYTPSDITKATPQKGDRPYAAWLYGSAGLSTTTEDHVDELELTLGVVGPEALGEQIQKMIHTHVTDSPTPKGWANQLDTEPGVILSWQRRWPRGPNGDWHLDFWDFRLNAEPNINVALGNIYTYAGTGLMFTFGPYQDTLQDTPPRVKPAMSGSGYFDVPDQNWSWYLFAGVDGRAVARNIFLDGNTFDNDSPNVDKKILVGDAMAGIAFTLYDYRLSYTANYRTKEFDGQPDDTFFGSITLTTRF
jgi:lipid A 3-O-deacylase